MNTEPGRLDGPGHEPTENRKHGFWRVSEWSFVKTIGAVAVAGAAGVATLGLTGIIALLPASALPGAGWDDVDGDLLWPLALQMSILWPVSLLLARIAMIWAPSPRKSGVYFLVVVISITVIGKILFTFANAIP